MQLVSFCIYALCISYYHVIVLLLFVIATLMYSCFICTVCIFVLYYYLLFLAILIYCYLICIVRLDCDLMDVLVPSSRALRAAACSAVRGSRSKLRLRANGIGVKREKQ